MMIKKGGNDGYNKLWYDFGLGKGGDIFTLAGEFLQSDDFRTQAKFIAEAANMTVTGWEKPAYLPKPIEPVFEDVEAVPLFRSPLTEYLAERGIPYAIASRHCCRLNYGVRGKRYFAVGFPNMAGGYEVRSRYFKGCIPPKDMSLVMAKEIPADECLVFEGFMDFLSAVTLGVTGNADCLVLNSVANVVVCNGKILFFHILKGMILCYNYNNTFCWKKIALWRKNPLPL